MRSDRVVLDTPTFDQARAKAREQIMDRLEGRPHVSMEVAHKDVTSKVIVLDSRGNEHPLILDAKEPPKQIEAEMRNPVYRKVRGGVFPNVGPLEI